MSPKITAHGGPSYADDPPKRKPKPFGQLLAAARRGEALTDPEPEPVVADEFFEPDEPAADVTAAFEAGEPGTTAEPEPAAPKKKAPKVVRGKGSAVVGEITGSA